MRFPDFGLVDFARGGADRRNNVLPIREAVQRGRDGTDCYITVHRFPAAYRDHYATTRNAKGQNTVKGYAGASWADYLPFDLDRAADVAAALADARAVGYLLHSTYDVDPAQLRYFFSGSKGFHLLAPLFLFGEVEPSPLLAATLKRIALDLGGQAGVKIDRTVYDVNRLFRLPNTRHGKTRLHKIELSWQELATLTVEEVRRLAAGPRDFGWQAPHAEPADGLVELFAKHADGAESEGERPGGLLRASGDGIASDLAEALRPAFDACGERHNLVLAFAGYAVKRHLPRETALGVADLLLIGAPNVQDPGNLAAAINDTYDGVRRGAEVKGYTALAELMHADDLARLADLLGDSPAPSAEPAATGYAPALADVIPLEERARALTSVARTMRRRGLEAEEIVPTLAALNARRCDPPLSDVEVARIAAFVARRTAARPLAEGRAA